MLVPHICKISANQNLLHSHGIILPTTCELVLLSVFCTYSVNQEDRHM